MLAFSIKAGYVGTTMSAVSVIMPTYNRGWIIERAIKSVLAQSFRDFELIVVDDGSSDDTKKKLAAHADKRIRILFGKHKGASAARNMGIRASKCPLLAFLDTDNVWHPTFLETMKAELKPDMVLAYSSQNMLLIGGTKKKPVVLGRKVRATEYNYTKLFNENYIDTNAALVRAVAVKKAGLFDTKLLSLEDWDLFTRIAISNPLGVKHVDQVLGDYYYYIKSVASTVTNKNFTERVILRGFGIHSNHPDRVRITKGFKRLARSRAKR